MYLYIAQWEETVPVDSLNVFFITKMLNTYQTVTGKQREIRYIVFEPYISG